MMIGIERAVQILALHLKKENYRCDILIQIFCVFYMCAQHTQGVFDTDFCAFHTAATCALHSFSVQHPHFLCHLLRYSIEYSRPASNLPTSITNIAQCIYHFLLVHTQIWLLHQELATVLPIHHTAFANCATVSEIQLQIVLTTHQATFADRK